MNKLRFFLVFYISVVLLHFLISVSYSQEVNIFPDYHASSQFSIKDIWNVNIVNSSSPIDVYLLGTIESSDSKLLIKGETSDFKLPSGTKKIKFNSVNPVDVTEYSNDIFKNKYGERFLPIGIYNVSISVLAKGSNKVLCSSINKYEISNLSQPRLISPFNGETIRGEFPIFAWHPLSTKLVGEKVTYEITIVNIYKGQTSQEAMHLNPFLIKKNNLLSGVFKYPVRKSELQREKKYAWMVKTIIDGKIFSESKIWEFEYTKDFKNVSVIEKKLQEKNNNKDSFSILNNSHKDECNFLKDFKYHYDDLKIKNQKLNILDEQINLNIRNVNSYNVSNFKQSYFLNDRLKESAGSQSNSEILFQLYSSYSIINYQYSNRRNVDSELPRNFFNLTFNPVFVFHDIPFSFNLYFDTKQNDIRQGINSFTFRLEPRLLNDILWKKKMGNNSVKGYLKFLSDFDALNIGEVYPNYSKYTLSGSKLTGVDIKYNPGLFYLAFSGLNNLKAIEGFNYSRKLFAGKIGLGAERGNHFHLTILKAWDDENSISTDQITNGATPQENLLMGADGKLKLLNDKLTITGEIVGSIHTRDKTSAIVEGKNVPEFLKFIIDPRVSTSVDYMYILKSTYVIENTNTKLSGIFKSIGPGYISLGSLGIRNDISGFKIKIDQRLLDRKIQFSASMEREKNNVGSFNSTTETTDNFGFNIRFNFKNFPYIILDYRPYTVANNEVIDSLLLDSRSSVFMIMVGVNDLNEDYCHSTNFLISSNNSKSNYEASDYKILNFNLSSDLTFVKYPLSFAGSIGYTFNDVINNSHIFTFDLSSSYTFFKNMNNTLGFSFIDEKNMNQKIGIYFSTSVSLWEIGDLYLRAEQNFYKEKVFKYGDNDEFILKATISKDWKF